MLQWRLDPLNTKISNKSNFLIFYAFLRIFYVSDFFLSMFFLNEQLENAYIKSLDSMQ